MYLFVKEDINLNTTTLAWPQKIKPVFEQNTEIVEDCKERIFFAKCPVIPNQMLTSFSCVGQVRREPAGEIGEHHQGARETQLEGQGAGGLGRDEKHTTVHL